jgi:hypothetical protein
MGQSTTIRPADVNRFYAATDEGEARETAARRIFGISYEALRKRLERQGFERRFVPVNTPTQGTPHK